MGWEEKPSDPHMVPASHGDCAGLPRSYLPLCSDLPDEDMFTWVPSLVGGWARRPENGQGAGRDIHQGATTSLASRYLHISSCQHRMLWFPAHLQMGKLTLRQVPGSSPLHSVSFLG